jgi:hypothetical protein
MIKGQMLSKYYLATPVFILVELFVGMNFRVSIPWDGDYLIYLYLAICFILGGFILKKPNFLNLFALFESSVNLFLLLLSVYLPVFAMANRPEEAGAFKFGMVEVIHFAIVGAVLLYAFYSNPIIKKMPI